MSDVPPEFDAGDFRSLAILKKSKKGLLGQLFEPDEYGIAEDGQVIGLFTPTQCEFEGRKFEIIKCVFDPSESGSPVLRAIYEGGQDIPVFQTIKHHSIVHGRRKAAFQFARSVPNSRIWQTGGEISIHDQARTCLGRFSETTSSEGVQLPPQIFVRTSLSAEIAQEIVATLLLLKYVQP